MADHPHPDQASSPTSLAIDLLRPKGDDTTVNWSKGGLCAQSDPDLFYPRVRRREQTTRVAKQICNRCPVVRDCLEYALRSEEEHGIWGGTTASERQDIRRLRGLPRAG